MVVVVVTVAEATEVVALVENLDCQYIDENLRKFEKYQDRSDILKSMHQKFATLSR